jgi:putative tryptophan/tyrosine transport system substrate-binding protein
VLGVALQPLEFRRASAFGSAVQAATQGRASALIVLNAPLTVSERGYLVRLAAQDRGSARYGVRESAEVGGLVASGPNGPNQFRHSPVSGDKIRQAANPGDLPVEQARKFELVFNLKTAEALALTIPPALHFQVEKVIR